jgi:hypothetical protein
MNREELEQKIKELESQLKKEKSALIKQFCDDNNPYKVGDIFTDHMGSIIVEKIAYIHSKYYGTYYCQYLGSVLKKDGTPRKDNSKRWALQTHDVKVKKEL